MADYILKMARQGLFLLKIIKTFVKLEAEFKEFEPRLKYGWLHLKSYLIFQDLSWRSIETSFVGFETRLKFIKFGHRLPTDTRCPTKHDNSKTT